MRLRAINKRTYSCSQTRDRLECDIAAEAIMKFLDRDNETEEATNPHPTDTALFAWSIARNIAIAIPDHINMAIGISGGTMDCNAW